MSATTTQPLPAGADRPTPGPAVLWALTRTETRRMLRNPVLWLGFGLATWMLWSVVPQPGEWAGASYEHIPLASVPLMFAISVVVAVSFARERVEIAPTAPVREAQRTLSRLAATLPLLAVAGGLAALTAWRERDLGGLWLGMEPGRTTDALHSAGELIQHVALAVLAVALGAALGRRVSRLVAVIPALVVFWFVVLTYWLFGAPSVTPFSILQVQPVNLPIGHAPADPTSFPAEWLLTGPDGFSDRWQRQFVSESLAWAHNLWLLGLSALALAFAVPGSTARHRLVLAGATLATLGIVIQFRVIP